MSSDLSYREIPFFNYRKAFVHYEEEFVEIFRDVLHRGAYILQKDLEELMINCPNRLLPILLVRLARPTYVNPAFLQTAIDAWLACRQTYQKRRSGFPHNAIALVKPEVASP
jgi:hypothetical protein